MQAVSLMRSSFAYIFVIQEMRPVASEALDRFADARYLNLETYRKTGAAIATPVWFAQDGARLYAYSLADAGKVKRIRNSATARIAPCDVLGKLRGDWMAARAVIVTGEEAALGMRMLDDKYGWQKKIGKLTSWFLNRRHAVISIELAAQA